MTTRIKSPTGVVHSIGSGSVAARLFQVLVPICNNYYYLSTTAWERTDEPVTCRTCLKMLAMYSEDCFAAADKIINEAYPDTLKKGPGWWGAQRIPNYGILRGAIAKALAEAKGDTL